MILGASALAAEALAGDRRRPRDWPRWTVEGRLSWVAERMVLEAGQDPEFPVLSAKSLKLRGQREVLVREDSYLDAEGFEAGLDELLGAAPSPEPGIGHDELVAVARRELSAGRVRRRGPRVAGVRPVGRRWKALAHVGGGEVRHLGYHDTLEEAAAAVLGFQLARLRLGEPMPWETAGTGREGRPHPPGCGHCEAVRGNRFGAEAAARRTVAV